MAARDFIFPHTSGTATFNGTALTAAGTYTGDWVNVADVDNLTIVFKSTNNDTDAGDTCDAYIDGRMPDGTVVNLGHFAQITGSSSDTTYVVTLTPNLATTTVVDATSDAAAGTFRAIGFPVKIRARVVTVNTSTNDESFKVFLSASGR